MRGHKEILQDYLPAQAVAPVFDLIRKYRVNLLINRDRKTRLGDFRAGINGGPHRISVNHNLNPYHFLITFVHELAHQLVWEKYQRRARPHGPEWKQQFRLLLQPFLTPDIFPADILAILLSQDKKIFASSSADTELARALKKYDRNSGLTILETLEEQAVFMLPDGRRFKKLHKRRKNYLCLCLSNRRNYVFNPLAEVIPLESPEK